MTLVQGIETDEDAMLAKTFGASYGQGFRYGLPGPLPEEARAPHEPFPLLQEPDTGDQPTPFELISGRREAVVVEKRVLAHLSTYLEVQALQEAPVVVISCLEDAGYLAGDTFARYSRIGSSAVFSAVLAPGLRADSAPSGVRVTNLSPWDRLAQEWDVLVLGPQFSGALVARACGDGSSGAFQRFEHVVTHDRDLVVPAARALLGWVTARSAAAGQGEPP